MQLSQNYYSHRRGDFQQQRFQNQSPVYEKLFDCESYYPQNPAQTNFAPEQYAKYYYEVQDHYDGQFYSHDPVQVQGYYPQENYVASQVYEHSTWVKYPESPKNSGVHHSQRTSEYPRYYDSGVNARSLPGPRYYQDVYYTYDGQETSDWVCGERGFGNPQRM